MYFIVKRERLGRFCNVLMHWSFFCEDIILKFWLYTQIKASFLFFSSFKCFCSSQKRTHNFKEFNRRGNICFKTGSISTLGLTYIGRRAEKAWLASPVPHALFKVLLLIPHFSVRAGCTTYIHINLPSPWILYSYVKCHLLDFGKERTNPHKPLVFEGIKYFD